MTPRGFILQPTYRVREGRPVIQLYGRLEDGSAFLVEDDRFRPYFFAPLAAADVLRDRSGIEIEETELRSFTDEALVRVTAPVPGDVPALRDALDADGMRPLEADIRFPYRYLIDHGIRACAEIDGEGEEVRPGFVRFANPTLRPTSFRPRLTALSIDLETTPDASAILSAALVGDGALDEVHLVYESDVEGAVVHADEAELLRAVNARIRAIDPDVITGWNVIDFDLQTWVARCKHHRIQPTLGRAAGDVRFVQDQRFTRQSRAEIPGRAVLDGIPLVRDAVRLDDYRLETAAQTLLGRGKKIAKTGDAGEEIQRLYREEPKALVAYNREDARLVLDILAQEGLLELAIERSLLSGMQLDRVGASVASFDLLYLPELRRRGLVAPSVDSSRKTEMVRGGALLDMQPGVFHNVAVFDFKSLYPSLIRTFQLDPLAHARAASEADAIEAPNGARFARRDAILPGVIERFMERRDEAKRRGDRHADHAIKIMMNAMFGVLGAAGCRFFDPAIANAITHFGQQTLHWTRDAFREAGVDVLYGDTDSVFVQLDSVAGGDEAHAEAEQLRDRAQAHIADRIHAQYAVEPLLLLELERVYDRLFLPRLRGSASGSKKRYAGWLDGHLEVVGLESVRRDYPPIAKRLQRGMLERLFTDRNVGSFVAEIVEACLSGELDEELVYTKRIRKGSLDRYTASTPPHIRAARKAGGSVGRTVRYLICAEGPEPILPGDVLPKGIDHRHYVEHVLRPIAEAILPHTGQSFEAAVGEPEQLSLL